MILREIATDDLRADLNDGRSLMHELKYKPHDSVADVDEANRRIAAQERIIEIILRELERRRIATYLE